MQQNSLGSISRSYGALYGLYAADSMAMPTHWMYDSRAIMRDYGVISKYMTPKDEMEGSIMSLSNTGGGGRGSDKGNIVGDVILHGKKKYWMSKTQYHYHVGSKAGDNTLEAYLARLATRVMNNNSVNNDFSSKNYLHDYIKFMTTPGNHPDSYAATGHRMFFKNWKEGNSPDKCADNDHHNVDSIDALTIAIPVIVKYKDSEQKIRNSKVMEAIRTMRDINSVEKYALIFSDMLSSVLKGQDLKEVCNEAWSKIGRGDLETIIKKNGSSDPKVV